MVRLDAPRRRHAQTYARPETLGIFPCKISQSLFFMVKSSTAVVLIRPARQVTLATANPTEQFVLDHGLPLFWEAAQTDWMDLKGVTTFFRGKGKSERGLHGAAGTFTAIAAAVRSGIDAGAGLVAHGSFPCSQKPEGSAMMVVSMPIVRRSVCAKICNFVLCP